MMKSTLLHFVQLILGLAITAAAVKAQAQMAVEGKLLFEDDFKMPAVYNSQRQQVAEGWTVQVAHAVWQRTSDGVQSIFRSGHMPVLLFESEHPFSNVVIEVEFRFHKEPGTNTNQGAACRISPTNPTLNPNAYSASVWANLDSKDRRPGMVLEHDEWGRTGITTVDHQPATFEPDKWYRVRMELIRNASLATCNGVTVYGTHERFGLPKTSIALGAGYCVHEFRRFRIYEATPNPKWTAPATKKASSDAKTESASGK
jgi:hypothetical protein